MRTICFLLSLILWCFAHSLFSTLSITWVFCALIVFYFHFYVGVLRTIFFYFNYYVGALRTICFLLLLLRWCVTHYLFSTLTMTLVFCALFVFYFNCYVGILRTICFILSLKCWCFAHYLFSTFTNVLLFCALFVFYFNYYVGVLRPFFLLSLIR